MLTILATFIIMAPAIMIAARQGKGTTKDAKPCVLCNKQQTTQSICQPCWELVGRKETSVD